MDDDERWQQVLARREPAQGFVYAVRTTGIYCVPTCASRRPLPTNVSFYDGPADARAAGYRACLRCRPDERRHSGDRSRAAVIIACRAMLEQGGPLPAEALNTLTGMSRRSSSRAFTAVLGTSAKAFGDAVRTGKARDLLRAGYPVTDAVFTAGFGSVRAFYDTAVPTLGMTPRSYAGGSTGENLIWTSVRSPVGTILAVASARGLCAVRIGDDVIDLLAAVRSEFPSSTLTADHEVLADVGSALVALATGERSALDLPLDIRGSAFQARVWNALTRIPAGETRSYAQIAAEIGSPSSIRAVAGACARNGIALVVPCHRVVRSDGALGGFRWGLVVKQSLLDAEQKRSLTAFQVAE